MEQAGAYACAYTRKAICALSQPSVRPSSRDTRDAWVASRSDPHCPAGASLAARVMAGNSPSEGKTVGSPLPGKAFWSGKRILGGRPGKTRVPSRVSRAGGRLFKERLDWETSKTFRSCRRVENAFCGRSSPICPSKNGRVSREIRFV